MEQLTLAEQNKSTIDGRQLWRQVSVFLLACLLSLPITFVGLRIYYDDARLQDELAKYLPASSFRMLVGKGAEKNGVFVVEPESSGKASVAGVSLASFDVSIYDRVRVQFAHKSPDQELSFLVRQAGETDQALPKNYFKEIEKGVSEAEVDLKALLPKLGRISGVGLVADNVLQPYQVRSMTLYPKKLDNVEFAALLLTSFKVNKRWENWSINTHKIAKGAFMSVKMLLFWYFLVVGVLYALYLHWQKLPVINAWWVTLVAAWLALDAHYLVEKTVITKNTYDTFAGLTDDEKDLVLSPEPATLAQAIKSALPDDGKFKKIRIQLGWERTWLKQEEVDKRYLNGKLQFYLSPNYVYAQGAVMPVEVWRTGGFYYADARKQSDRLRFDVRTGQLALGDSDNLRVPVKRLLANKTVDVYYVTSEKARRVK